MAELSCLNGNRPILRLEFANDHCNHSQMHLAQFLRQLTRLAEEFGIAVVITNQVQPFGVAHDLIVVVDHGFTC